MLNRNTYQNIYLAFFVCAFCTFFCSWTLSAKNADQIALPETNCPGFSIQVIYPKAPQTNDDCETLYTVAIQGGRAPYRYDWLSQVTSKPDHGATFEPSGFYGRRQQELTITDADGCVAKDSFLIQELSKPSAKLTYQLTETTITFFMEDSKYVSDYLLESTDLPNYTTIGQAMPLPLSGVYSLKYQLNNPCGSSSIRLDNIIVGGSCENLSIRTSRGEHHLSISARGGTPPYTYKAGTISHNGSVINYPTARESVFRALTCTGREIKEWSSVSDASGCVVTDTIATPALHPDGEVRYKIEDDQIIVWAEESTPYFSTSYMNSNIPGGLVKGKGPIPPAGTYSVCFNVFGSTCTDIFCGSITVEEVVKPSCEEGIPMDITLSTQEQIDRFEEYYACSACTDIKGALTIEGADITDLSGLSFLTSVSKQLRIENCPNLTSLQGLENISSVGSSIALVNLPKLENLSGLNGAKLGQISLNLNIRHNANLVDISALQGITTVAQHLMIVNNPKLTNLNGLQDITRIGKRLTIQDMPNLEDGSALCNLFTDGEIGGILTISGNKYGCNNPSQILKSCNAFPDGCNTKAVYFYQIKRNTVQFGVNRNNPVGTKFLWKLEDGTFRYTSSLSFSHTFLKAGTYKVNLKILGSCRSGLTETIVIPKDHTSTVPCKEDEDNNGDGVVNTEDIAFCECVTEPTPKANFNFLVDGNKINLTNLPALTYGWARWSSPYEVVNNEIIASNNISFNVCLELETLCHKKDTYCQTISIGNACAALTTNREAQSRTIVPDIEKTKVVKQTLGTVQPNPTYGQTTLNFNLDKPTKVQLELYSLSGQQTTTYLNQVPYPSGQHQVDISLANLPAGIFLMRFQTTDTVWTEKIVKIE